MRPSGRGGTGRRNVASSTHELPMTLLILGLFALSALLIIFTLGVWCFGASAASAMRSLVRSLRPSLPESSVGGAGAAPPPALLRRTGPPSEHRSAFASRSAQGPGPAWSPSNPMTGSGHQTPSSVGYHGSASHSSGPARRRDGCLPTLAYRLQLPMQALWNERLDNRPARWVLLGVL